MKQYRIGILRVWTTDDKKALAAHQDLMIPHFPEFTFETRCIPNQYKGLYNQQAHEEALPVIVQMATEWEPEIDGLIVSCVDDPGVEILKTKLKIPVVGAGTAVACLGLMTGLKLGVMGITQKPTVPVTNLLKEKMLGYVVPEGVESTVDLQGEEAKKSIIRAASKLKALGAEAIILSCTGLSTVGAASFLNDAGYTAIDGVIASGIAMRNMLLLQHFNSRNG